MEGKIVVCPNCQQEYSKSLYDWQYIYCEECHVYFEKHSGKFIKRDGDPQKLPQKYWKTDKELQHE